MEDVLARVASYAGNWHAMSLVSRGLARRRLCRAWLGAHFDRSLDCAARHPEHTRNLAPGFFLRMLAAGADGLVHPPRGRAGARRGHRAVYSRPVWRARAFYHAALRAPRGRRVLPWSRCLTVAPCCHHAFRLTYVEVVLCRRRAFTALALIY